MVKWVTADQHYGHANIIKYCDRPFRSVGQMNEALIANHNEVVAAGDVVYHIGDFAWGDPVPYLKRLNGTHHLIVGSHDKARYFSAFASVQPVLMIDGVWLSHYAHRVWPRSHYGTFHLYGHSHGKLAGWGKSMDVGVDCLGYTPITLEAATIMIMTMETNDDKSKSIDRT